MPGRTIVITGSSDGIGAAAARQLSAAGRVWSSSAATRQDRPLRRRTQGSCFRR